MKILLLEDDELLHESIKAYLEYENFEIISAFSSDDVYSLTYDLNNKNKFDLYIFDVNVSGDDGFEILKSLRKADDNTPTIYITALNDISSISEGFNSGACDYIKKPFDIMELVIRIKSKYINTNEIVYKNIIYNTSTQDIKYNGKTIYLSQTLQILFHQFITNINQVLSYDLLFEYSQSSNKNALKSNISKLKSKLQLNIINIRDTGYKLE